jgi:hypothetical protein
MYGDMPLFSKAALFSLNSGEIFGSKGSVMRIAKLEIFRE